MKRSLVFFLVLVFAFSMVACSSQSGGDEAVSDGKESGSGGEFSWDKHSGKKITVMLNQHPYAEAIIEKLPEFEEKTGIEVEYSVTPEENYFDKLTTSLSAKNGNPDVFMTGSYQIWEYASAGDVQELDSFLEDSGKTSPDYDVDDFFEGIINADRWDLKPGHEVGTGNLWAVPLGFEVYALSYNKKAFEKAGLEPPKTFDELMEIAPKLNGWNGKGSYGIAVRGTRSWATIHPGYMTGYYLSGAKDFEIKDGKLVSAVDSPEAIEFTKKWVEMIKSAGPEDWSNYTWYQASSDLGAGKAAMMFDGDNTAFFQNIEGASKEAGNIAWAPAPKVNDEVPLGTNVWVWSIAMNASSQNKDAAWLFMQYFTSKEHQLWAATEGGGVDPARKSVWEAPEFIERMSEHEGYEEQFKAVIENSSIKFTPQPEFFNTTTEWAAALQDIVGGADVEKRMKQLAADINERVSRIRVE